jgi:hypothetical protein
MQEFFDAPLHFDDQFEADEAYLEEEGSEIDSEHERQDPAEAAQPQQTKRRTGKWYYENRLERITPGHTVTVLQACYWLARWKNAYRISDIALTTICYIIHYLILPRHNLFPPSYHIMKAILDVPAASECEAHVCDACWRVFPHLHPSQYHAHANDKCAGCGKRRFNVSAAGKPTANRSAYRFGDKETVEDILSAPGLLDGIASQRAKNFLKPWTFWGSAAGRQLDKACNHKFSKPGPGEMAVLFSGGARLHLLQSHTCNLINCQSAADCHVCAIVCVLACSTVVAVPVRACICMPTYLPTRLDVTVRQASRALCFASTICCQLMINAVLQLATARKCS